jgi:hypothetical protein
MKLKTEQIVGIAGLLGVAYYAFFCKKKPTGESATEETSGGGGGGIGGGGFAPPTGLIALQTPTPPAPAAPSRPASQGRSYTAAEVTKSKNITPTAASTSSTSVGAQSGVGVTNTGGIKGIGASTSTGTGGFIPTSQGGSTTPTYSTGTVTQSQMSTGLQGGSVFKPFSGKGALTLDNLLM